MNKIILDYKDEEPEMDFEECSKSFTDIEFLYIDDEGELIITADYDVSVEMGYSCGNYETPPDTWVEDVCVNVWNWTATTTEGDEVDLSAILDARLELALIQLIRDTYQ